jgi:putative IMPACT (imprinted ancient) family translation regulator
MLVEFLTNQKERPLLHSPQRVHRAKEHLLAYIVGKNHQTRSLTQHGQPSSTADLPLDDGIPQGTHPHETATK